MKERLLESENGRYLNVTAVMNRMDAEHWQQIDRLFRSVIELSPDERAAFLDHACAGDSALRSEVESIIASREGGGDALGSTVVEMPTVPLTYVQPRSIIGDRIGRYQVIEHIGKGGMGDVYLAQDTELGRRVALKLVRPELAKDETRLRRFQLEARAASALNHPNILTVYEIGQADDLHFIATEYVEGETLRKRIARAKMKLEEVLDVAIQVAGALSAAHQAGIVHRDIKPENLMLRSDGYVKVLDFGIAKFAEKTNERQAGNLETAPVALVNTEPGVLMGSPSYMSPEQARGLDVDSRSDIFSLGVVLYEMLTGSPPFAGATVSDVLVSILTAEPLPLNRYSIEIPEPLQQIVAKALAKEKGERFQLMGDLALDLKSLMQEMEYEARLESSGQTESAGEARPIVTIQRRHTVGRERERVALEAGFESAAAGRALLLCVSGEPGIGKTTLVEDFIADLVGRGTTLTVARGRCSERLAGAEAYLPFLEALDGLLKAGDIGRAAQVMKLVAPTWYVQLAPLSVDNTSDTRMIDDMKNASQERMKRELSAFLEEMSRRRPLLLFLDDVHWADVSTIDLLAYLATKFDSMRLLIVATYRPSDLLLAKHPFLQVKLALQGRGVCRDIALEFLSRRDIERYLDLEFPEHRFSVELATLIHTRTEGNPLFMVDIVRYLRDRQVIARDEGGWTLVQAVTDIERDLPESIRSMIERKIDQLGKDDLRLLVGASVQGYEFDSAVVSNALAIDPAEVEERLDLLERVFAFVRISGEGELPDGTLTLRYRFVHALYQNALYASLGPTRRASLSKAVAEALLGHYREQSSDVASALAQLLETARDFQRATDYFLLAAQRAADVFAFDEAANLARRGLKLLKALSDSPQRTQKELMLQLIVGFSLSITRGSATPEMGESMTRAREICEQLGESPQLFPVIWGLWAYYFVGAELQQAREMAEKTLRLAESAKAPALLVGAHYAMGSTLQIVGELVAGHEHLERAIALDDPQQHGSYSSLYKLNPRIYSQAATVYTLWQLGYPEQSMRRLDETLTLAQSDRDPRSLAHALWFATFVHQLRRDVQSTQKYAETCIAHCNEHGIAQERDWVAARLGWAMAEQGMVEEGIARMRESLDILRARRADVAFTFSVTLLVEALMKNSQLEEGLTVVDEALTLVRRTGERSFEAEMHRLKGELLILQAAGDHILRTAATERPVLSEAEACFHQAIEISRWEREKSFELRAVMSLSRLYEKHGKREEARQMLSEIYGRFTEGFDTADLREARMLLEEVSEK